jgi:hypothetical protein
MPRSLPPHNAKLSPHEYALSAGALIFRVHKSYREPVSFNPTPADSETSGGRFDSTSDFTFTYMYAALHPQTAILEDIQELTSLESYRNNKHLLADRELSVLRVLHDMRLIALLNQNDLASVGQDEWLTSAGSSDYAYTRRWGHLLRTLAPWAQGIIWSSRRFNLESALVLFGDRCSSNDFHLEQDLSHSLNEENLINNYLA